MSNPEIIDLGSIPRADTTINLTYSGFIDAEGNYNASVLSRMNAFAAFVVARENGSYETVIAGEQSSSTSQTTTGEVLSELAPADTPKVRPISFNGLNLLNTAAIEVDTTPDFPENLSFRERYQVAKARNLNTGFQAELLAAELEPDQDVTVVTTDFHAKRVMDNLAMHDKRFKHATLITMDQVFNTLRLDAALEGQLREFDRAFMEEFGLEVNFETVQRLALTQFAARENGPLMSWAHRLSPGARVHKIQSARTLTGRYDDIAPDGNAIMEMTT